jgi:nicotinate-nucleotide pyrophosphorylase (carboxylating)
MAGAGVQKTDQATRAEFGWEAIVDLALAEDIGTGDITTRVTVPEGTTARGVMLAKAAGVISGIEVARYVFQRYDPRIEFEALVADGTAVTPGTELATVRGPARSLLTAERTALNLIQRLSGVATETARYVNATEGTKATIVDTRKTTPGLREMEKAAVGHGGGANHRFGLADGVLIKDNHLAALMGPGRVTRAVRQARAGAPHTLRIEVEVTTLDELGEALEAGADIVLLDNMSNEEMAEAVRRTNGTALLEASGGISLERVRSIAVTGVDLISVGALTHSAPALDISLELTLGDARAV